MPTVPDTSSLDRPEGPARESRGFGLVNKVTACHRCHARKVKCSGGNPCQNCRQAEKGPQCSYPQRTRQVKVTQRFIESLYEEIEQLKRQNSPGTLGEPNTSASAENISPQQPSGPTVDEQDPFLNPAVSTKPWFDNVNMFNTPILIGEVADAAFATRFRQIISDPQAPLPSHLLRMNYATNESLMSLTVSSVDWPSPPRARFLIEAALQYISRSYYIVRRSSIMEGLRKSSQDPTWGQPLLRHKFWVLFAIGELFSARSITTNELPGTAYFSQASKMLGILDERPGTDSIEILLLLSFYSLALNRRYSAYILSGTAMRTAIVMGLHLNVPDIETPDPGVQEHRRRLFWTSYTFDRLWASKLGHPPAIQDEDIQADLPSKLPQTQLMGESIDIDFADPAYQIASVKLASLLTKAIHSVYSFNRHDQGPTMSTRVRSALKDLQIWVESLPPHLQIDQSSMEALGPMTASLHLCFNQCVILATRPIVLHILKVHVAASSVPPQKPVAGFQVSASASAVSEACVRCARHSIRLLKQAWIGGFFVTYDCSFTQYLFSSLTILALSSLLDGQDSHNDRDSFNEASHLLFQLKDAGNCVAQEYCHHLEAMRAALEAFGKRKSPPALNRDPDSGDPKRTERPGQTFPAQRETVAMDLAEPTLQELLAQPELDLQFLEDAIQADFSQGAHWADMSSGWQT